MCRPFLFTWLQKAKIATPDGAAGVSDLDAPTMDSISQNQGILQIRQDVLQISLRRACDLLDVTDEGRHRLGLYDTKNKPRETFLPSPTSSSCSSSCSRRSAHSRIPRCASRGSRLVLVHSPNKSFSHR